MAHENNPKKELERAITTLRGDQPDQEVMQAAGQRVWQRLGEEAQAGVQVSMSESIHGCEDILSLLPQYRSGGLAPAKALLVADHLRECVACRKEAEKGDRSTLLPWKQEVTRASKAPFRWLTAVAAVVLFSFVGYLVLDKLAIPAGARARVESVDGALYKVSRSGEQALQAGEEVAEGDKLRTGGASRAMVRLRDGSLVEMNEHAEFSVSLRRKDTTLHLDRGDIIVQAAKRDAGHLYIAAPDCTVSVTGTVFSVNSGLKGSRVSVVQGEVRVAESGVTSVLHPGDQLSTNASVAAKPIREELAWSKDRDKLLALLGEFSHLSKKMEAVQLPGLRYQSRILPALPQTSMFVASVPNYSDAIQQANKLFQQELQTSSVLREWWQQVNNSKPGSEVGLQMVIDKVHDLGQYLGNEIVFSMSLGDKEHPVPLIAAEVSKPGLKAFLEQQIAPLHGKEAPLRILDEQELMSGTVQPKHPGQAKPDEMFVLVGSDLVVSAPTIEALRDFTERAKRGSGGFASTPFGQRLAHAYTEGAGLLIGADLEQMSNRAQAGMKREAERAAFERSGFSDVRFLIAERKDVDGQALNRAELAFNGARHGIASWLGAPAPMGGLDFVSQDAGAVVTLVVKKPGQILNDAAEMAEASGTDANAGIAMLGAALNIRVREDLVDTLGGEITLALDGPVLPTPSWKVVAEVNDPARLQETLRKLVAFAGTQMKANEKINIDQQTEDGITYYTFTAPHSKANVEINYAFNDGYLVIGPSRALVKAAVQIHKNGNSLAKSANFRKLLPQDRNTNVSALLYQNISPALAPLAQTLSPSQLQVFQQLAAESKPSAVCAYGEENSILVASNTRLFDLNTLALTSILEATQSPAGARMHHEGRSRKELHHLEHP
ncbi:MAG TPA: FecR domain-containing protein [Candidatus Angelobacter sp.]|nr:FecR domain-containing protein [Candidatus Angelobacter sp.]